MKMPKIKFLSGKNYDFVLRIYAVVLAILIWFILSITLYPTITRTISNVPVTIKTEGTIAADYLLSPVNFQQQDSTVKISGMRYEIGNYSADDLEARVVVSGINKPGEYDLPIEVVSKDGKRFDVLSIKPSTVKVKFDSIIEKDFNVIADAPNAKAEKGYLIDPPIAMPNSVTIKGPKSEIEKITKVVVKTDSELTLTESQNITDTKLVIYNGDTIMDNSIFTFGKDNVSIQIPIYMIKTLPFKIEIQNAPKNFDMTSLKYSFSHDSIDIAAPSALISDLANFHLGYIDLRSVALDYKTEFPVHLQVGYRNLSGFDKISVAFDTSNYAIKTISVNKSQIHIINSPSNYNISLQTVSLQNIKLVGPKDAIKNITSADIIAEIDLLHTDITDTTYAMPVQIYCPSYNNVWAYGNYTATLNINKTN